MRPFAGYIRALAHKLKEAESTGEKGFSFSPVLFLCSHDMRHKTAHLLRRLLLHQQIHRFLGDGDFSGIGRCLGPSHLIPPPWTTHLDTNSALRSTSRLLQSRAASSPFRRPLIRSTKNTGSIQRVSAFLEAGAMSFCYSSYCIIANVYQEESLPLNISIYFTKNLPQCGS